MCPRCSAKVTADRYAAEATEHACSLCTTGLDLHAATGDTAAAPNGVPAPSGQKVPQTADDDDSDDSVDAVIALQEAAAEAEAGLRRLEAEFRNADRSRTDAEEAAQRGRQNLQGARARLQAELELARAESALETLRGATRPEPPSPVERERLLVLQTASKLTKSWVKEDQDPLLKSVSTAIAELARRFGSTNITAVSLKGNGNMTVHKGGAEATYSGLTNGEKLRIKLAAAIALIKLGHTDGVGRHPGLLFVDSPAAEEIPEADLRTMLEAMTAVAAETDLQIVVATTHGPMLSEVLPEENLLVATGTDFVW
jgi:hypothetical protein